MKELKPQPPSVANDEVHIADVVVKEILQRKAMGLLKYGVPLQPHNGRSAIQDAYEESLDQTLYLRQALEEERTAQTLVDGEIEKIAIYVATRGSRMSDRNWSKAELAAELAEEIRARAYRDTIPAPPPIDDTEST